MEIRGKRIKPLIEESQIRIRVKELAREVERAFQEEESIVVVGLLKGAFIFVADLIRNIEKRVLVDFMWVSSYGQATESSGKVRIIKDVELDLKDRSVLLVDDILDTGYTLKEVYSILLSRRPKVLKTCVLLDKKERRKVDFNADFVGFEVPNRFLVGYGLDWGEEGRNLPGIFYVED